LDKAAEEARRLRQNWLGPEHYLLAVLAEPSVATETMAELGVTYDRLAPEFGRMMKFVNGRRVRYIEAKGITTNPAAHNVSGWAKGFAGASARERPTSEDWLLSIVYCGDSVVASALHNFGVSAAAVVDAIRRRGLKTPDFEPEEHRPWRGPRTTEVARSEWQAVVDLLNEKHPPGSAWRWGFNSRKDRPGKIQFAAEEGIDLEAIVAEARAGQART
jgi:ATP-dependent Clp protease ATP-binding subunit ClpA